LCWLSNGTIVIPFGKAIAKFNPKTDTDWSVLHLFTEADINEISRIAVSPNGKYMAIVAEESPAKVVQKQVESFNNMDLDAFASCYSRDVVVRDFRGDTLYVGNDKLKSSYAKYFKHNNNTKVKVLNRIVIGNQVIDEELVTKNVKSLRQVAIYETKNGQISSMTFIFKKKAEEDAEIPVKAQLDAYNKRDIDGFVNSFSEDIIAYDYPNKFSYKGKAEFKKIFTDYFASTPDLHSDIITRIVLGNIVIDEEYVTNNGDNFYSVAIYEVAKGKIVKMTFLR